MAELGPRWTDSEAEYETLTMFLIPAAHARYERALQNWDALDTKALGLLALAAAAIAGLAAVHDAVHSVWWLPAAGFAAAGGLLIASTWPRTVDLGPDLIDFHDETRDSEPLAVARAAFNQVATATEDTEATVADKYRLFVAGLGVLAVSLVASLPVILLGP